MLDADIRGFFDAIDHGWLLKFVEHRIADRKTLRLVRKWLNAGVMEDGAWTESKVGTPQGATISPLLANIYLHYVLDLWIQQWRTRHATGDVIIVRYADDFLVGFISRGLVPGLEGESGRGQEGEAPGGRAESAADPGRGVGRLRGVLV